MKNLKYGMVAL